MDSGPTRRSARRGADARTPEERDGEQVDTPDAERTRVAEEQKKLVEAIHPVIRTHPVTGRKCIFVNDSTTVKILGVSDSESEDILGELRTRCIRQDFIFRHKWQVGDVLMWDNCATQHQAIADYALPQRRRMHRTTITGTVPF